MTLLTPDRIDYLRDMTPKWSDGNKIWFVKFYYEKEGCQICHWCGHRMVMDFQSLRDCFNLQDLYEETTVRLQALGVIPGFHLIFEDESHLGPMCGMCAREIIEMQSQWKITPSYTWPEVTTRIEDVSRS